MGAADRRWNTAFRFTWLGSERIPATLDLRRCGWVLERRRLPCPDCIGLIDATTLDGLDGLRALASYPAELRRFIMATGVTDAMERAALLLVGFADAVGDAIGMEELEARAARTARLARWLPQLRDFGDLKLDLLAREAYGHDRPLNLNPREFALLWRLADSPCKIVSKQALIHDVWRLGFVPATNSIAVHMSRLRRKLGFAGLDGIITTASHGGYCLRIPALGEEDERATLPPGPVDCRTALSTRA